MAVTVIGVSEAGVAGLPVTVQECIGAGDIVIAAPRFHGKIPHGPEIIEWPSPFTDIFPLFADNPDKSIVVLATGDPLWFGAGAALIAHLGVQNCEIIPGVSGFQAAASRMGWPIAQCETLSIHGAGANRAAETIIPHLYPRARLLVIARNGDSPAEVASVLSAAGYGNATIEVLAHIGADQEARYNGHAANWAHDEIPDFHIIAVECGEDVAHHGIIALPDAAFENDGKLTKRDARASALAKLAPFPGAVLWDVGSGSGAIAIDFLRNAPCGAAYGIDKNRQQIDMASRNARANGVPALNLIEADLPSGLDDLPRPDAIFIGGGLSDEVVQKCQSALRCGGVLVVHAVTIESETVITKNWQKTGGSLTRLSIHHADPVGAFHGWRGLMPVTQWHWCKDLDNG